MKILVTGSAGFIGFNVAKKLLLKDITVVGIDNHNDYYDQNLKENRLNILNSHKNYQHHRADISDQIGLEEIFKNNNFDIVINLAAQAGVRYSIENPSSYFKSNLSGFFNILECCKNFKIKHLVYASSSSVYGANTSLPFNEKQHTSHPLSLYAATKRCNEILAHSYSSIFNLNTSGLRFFTVYGPWGRPDMALFKFTASIVNDEPIEIYNNGNHVRDFTYIDDVVEMILRVAYDYPFKSNDWDGKNPDSSSSSFPWRTFNIGNGNPQPLMSYIKEIEKQLGKEAKKIFLPMQAGDVPETSSDISKFRELYDYMPRVQIDEGVMNFISWYKEYNEKFPKN